MHLILPPPLATSTRLACRAALMAVAWGGFIAAALGESSAGPADDEILLSYRRAGASDSASSAVSPNGGGAASAPALGENRLRPSNEPAPPSIPAYQFGAVTPPAPAGNSGDAGNAMTGAPSTDARDATPPAGPTEESAPAMMPRYGEVMQAVHDAPTATDAGENSPEQPIAAADVQQPAEPQQTPEASAPLPGVALPLSAAAAPAADESRHLAPRTKPFMVSTGDGQSLADGIKSRLPDSFSKLDSLTTAGAGLAIVVGLFFVCMWLLRRSGGTKHGGLLPNEAFAVLGRAPLTPQSVAQLLRVGNKLVLVAVSADGIQPLTEVIDPIEVDRLTGVCASGRGHGPAAEFQQVLAQLAREPAQGFLGAEAANGRGRRRA